MSSGDIFNFIGAKYYVPTASALGFTVIAGMNSVVIKFGAGSSLSFGGETLSTGNGYLMTLGEVLCFDTRGTFYLQATGSTATVYIITGKADGV